MESRGTVESHSHCADRAQVQDFSWGRGGEGRGKGKGMQSGLMGEKKRREERGAEKKRRWGETQPFEGT